MQLRTNDSQDSATPVWEQPYDYPPVDSPVAQGIWIGWASLGFVVIAFPMSMIYWAFGVPCIAIGFVAAIVACIRSKGRSIGGWITFAICGFCICMMLWGIIAGT
jgi:hypothetical protein